MERQAEASDQELDQDSATTSEKKQLAFMNIISEFPVLLDKSQIPSMKANKEKAYLEAIEKLKSSLGLTFDKKSLCKKISRMKNDVKVKCDTNRIGNKKIELRDWENVMLKLIHGESNPTITKVLGAVSVGTSRSKTTVQLTQSSPMENENTTVKKPLKRKIIPTTVDGAETEETRLLSDGQLQRLVLLEQLKVLRLKQQKLHSTAHQLSPVYIFPQSEFNTTDA